MYIDKLLYDNIGPISKININFRFKENGDPVPVILVGKNGSGKSILLSNIVDAFYELAERKYNNATQKSGSGHQYFKNVSANHIKIGREYMTAYIEFRQEKNSMKYLFKAGNIDYNEYCTEKDLKLEKELDWKENRNYKKCMAWGRDVIQAFDSDIVCYFGPSRYEKPDWMGTKYYPENAEHYSMAKKYDRELCNPISAVNDSHITLQWLFDVIADSRADLLKNDDKGYNIMYPSESNLNLLTISRKNAEKLMSAILDQEVMFRMGNRSRGGNRFSICTLDGDILIPSLDALSTGQMALFNMFVTIIRYADNADINLSHRIEDISGIVVIDEIDLHLHGSLQREVLPRLIALFPKIQFIITSHSPLFLLGMNERYGEENLDILEMPEGKRISAEEFSEFENAYQYYTETNTYHNAIHKLLQENKNKPLLITEGATDWKHMKAALVKLRERDECPEWLKNLEFEFLEYEPENSPVEAEHKLKMSGSQLQNMCEQYSLLKQSQKMIFVADCDVPDVKKALSSDGKYKDWGNNIYSFCLPVPEHRHKTPNICIEHLYSDDVIKTEIDINGIKRRIFMGNEFDENGFSINEEDKFYCKNIKSCGKDKIDIIDGSDKKKVIRPWSESRNTNVALSKMDFANYILDGKAPFDEMDFSAFIPIFENIRDILNL